MEYLTYYAAFAVSGGLVSTWKLFLPAIEYIEIARPSSKALKYKPVTTLVFFGWATVLAPFMIVCLAYEDQFKEVFIDNLLKIDRKK